MTAVMLWFRKDVRRFALWLVVWAGVLGLRVAIDAGAAMPWLGRVAVDNLGVAATTLLFLLIVVLVVHEDPPGDLRAFWTTRAVSGRQLFAAKALFVMGLLVLPAATVDLADIAAAGIESGVVAQACPEIFLEWSAWAMATMALAAVTTTLPGFLGGAFAGGLVVLVTWGVALVAFVPLESVAVPLALRFFDFSEPSADEVRLMMALREGARAIGMAAIVALWAAFVAERTWGLRRIRMTRWALLGSVAALTLLWILWPYGTGEQQAARSKSYDDVRFALDPVGRSAPTVVDQGGATAPRMEVSGHFTFTGLPEGLTADVVRVPGTLGYVDNTTFQTHANVGRTPMAATWNVAEIERLLDGARLVNVDAAEREGFTPLTRMPVEQFDARRQSHGRLELRAHVLLRRYEVSAILPLAPGATFRQNDEEFVVERTMYENQTLAVQARGAYLSLWIRPGLPRIKGMFMFRFDPGVLWVLRNPMRREAVLPQQGMAIGFGWPTHTRLDQISWVLAYESPGVVDESWLRDAELVRIAVTTEGELYHSFVLPAFAIDEAAGKPDPADARVYAPTPSPPPPQMSAPRRELADEPGVAVCTLSDAALMTLDWRGETMRTAGLSVVARREAPESGVEFDVRVDARPRTVPSAKDRWQDDNALYVVSSERGGRRALVDLDVAQYEAFALRFTLVSIDGREPGYDTPQIRVGAINSEARSPEPYLLAVPDWSTIAYAATGNKRFGPPPRLRQVGFVMQLADSRWSNRGAMLRLRVEPVASATELGPTKNAKEAPARRATLSLHALRSLVAIHGGVFMRDPSAPEGAVDLDLRVEGNAIVRLPDELLVQLRREYDFVEVRATLLAVNGRTDGVQKRVAVSFVGTPLMDAPQLSLEQADPSAIVSLAPDRLDKMVALNVAPLWTGRSDDAMNVESVTLRLEPVPDATPVP